MDLPEKKSPTEPLDLQRKIEDTLAGTRPIEWTYPYFSPDYEMEFTHIGTEKQLFIDNFMLDHLDGVERVFPEPKRPDEPVMEIGGLPWEDPRYANPILAGAVQDPDDGKFKLWYAMSQGGDPYNSDQVLCYAESTDCLHWTKPLSADCVPYKEHKRTNIVLTDVSAECVVLNPDRSDPNRKFLMVYCPYGRAKEVGQPILSSVAVSPDGLRWTTISEDNPFRHQHRMSVVWDESIRRWVGLSQHSHMWHHGPRTRQIGRQESEDFINWSPKEVVLSADWEPNMPPEMEYGAISVRLIGGLYIGIVSEYPCEPLWRVNQDIGSNWRDQVHPRFGLFVSRDAKRWHRAGKCPWINNRGPGSQDYGYMDGSVTGQMVRGGKTYIGYSACPSKQWAVKPADPRTLVPDEARNAAQEDRALLESLGIDPGYPSNGPRRRATGMLILREDGWAELRPSYEYGKAYTKQFVFEGDSLKVNADCAYGCVVVEVLDPYLKPYEGFSRADCDPVHCTDPETTWHRVTWRGNPDVSKLWNKPCRLLFHLHEASLYGFQFEYGVGAEGGSGG